MSPDLKKISIIIPAYNEEKTIHRLVENIMRVRFPVDYEILIVDDHSHDRTYKIANLLSQRLSKQDMARHIQIFRNDINRGKGFSIQRGLEHAAGDIVVVQDADFEYDPAEIPRLMAPILEGRAEVVYGSRFLKTKSPQGMAFANRIANLFLTWATNVLYGSSLTDMETCYKLIRREIMTSLRLSARRFDFEPEVTSKLIKKRISILELPIDYHGRTAAEGKKIKARDFFIALWVLLANRFRS